MKRHSSFLKGGLTLTVGQVTSQACSFVRSAILARLISPADYGVAAAFAMTLSLLDMLSNLSSDKLLVQASDGDEPGFQKTTQLLHFSRGLGNGAIIYLLAGPVSRLFDIPQAVWAFRCLALLPLLRGLVHQDLNRLQREMRFGPFVVSDVGSNIVATLLALPFGLWLHNYWAMLWILVAQSLVGSVASHLLAERRYGWGWERRYAKRMFSFGWPLLVNGFLLYGIMEGDRVIIGSARRLFSHGTYTLTDLGIYSVAFAVTMAPQVLAGNVSLSLFLPLLSRAKESYDQFERQYLRCLYASCLAAALMSIPFIFGGGFIVKLVYGSKYAGAAGFIGWLAAMWGLRLIRTAPQVATIARADTKTAMITNGFRSLALVGMLVAAASGAPLGWIAMNGFFGEILALAVILFRMQWLHGIPVRLALRPFGVIGVGMASAAALSAISRNSFGAIGMVVGSIGLIVMTFTTMLLMVPNLRSDIMEFVSPLISARQRALKAEVGV